MGKDILDKVVSLYFIGIGGSGMSGLAKLLRARGFKVTGTDERYDELKSDQRLLDLDLHGQDSASARLSQVECAIVSDAISEDNPVYELCVEMKLPIVRYCEALGWLSGKYHTIAIAGTHGKSSTTAILGHIMSNTGMDPTVLCGANVPGWPQGNIRIGTDKYFVVEADEYRHHFLDLEIKDLIITTVDYDHPDVFKSELDTENAFIELLNKVPGNGKVVLTADVADTKPGIREIVKSASNIHIVNEAVNFDLAIPGDHMRMNATLAIEMAVKLGVDREKAKLSLSTFRGLERRFEILGEIDGMKIISDYGHHPTEISATIKAARGYYENASIAVLFEAHTFNRLNAFWGQFVQSLSVADHVLVAPVYKARDEDVGFLRGSKELVTDLNKEGVQAESVSGDGSLWESMVKGAENSDVLIAFSAGKLDFKLRALLKEKGAK